MHNVKQALFNNSRFWQHTSHNSKLLQDSAVIEPVSHSAVSICLGRTNLGTLLPPYEMSQLVVSPDDYVNPDFAQAFPRGATDVNQQQVDLRIHNSWTMRLHEIPTTELAEVV